MVAGYPECVKLSSHRLYLATSFELCCWYREGCGPETLRKALHLKTSFNILSLTGRHNKNKQQLFTGRKIHLVNVGIFPVALKQVTHGDLIASVGSPSTLTIHVQGVLIKSTIIHDTEGHIHLKRDRTISVLIGHWTAPERLRWPLKILYFFFFIYQQCRYIPASCRTLNWSCRSYICLCHSSLYLDHATNCTQNISLKLHQPHG